jgi:hypothetical protein
MCTLGERGLSGTAPSDSGLSAVPEPDKATIEERPGAELLDSALLQEIALLADVIASLAGIDNHLTREQVDAMLGVPAGRAPTSLPGAAHPSGFVLPAKATA